MQETKWAQGLALQHAHARAAVELDYWALAPGAAGDVAPSRWVGTMGDAGNGQRHRLSSACLEKSRMMQSQEAPGCRGHLSAQATCMHGPLECTGEAAAAGC